MVLCKGHDGFEHFIVSCAVSSEVHGIRAVIWHVEKCLFASSAEGTDVTILLAPFVEVIVGGKGPKNSIEGKLHWFRWKLSNTFSQ